MPTKLSPEIINAAIIGFEQQKSHIDAQIAELRPMLSGGPAESAARPEPPTGKRKQFSAAARQRMKEAQQRRWAKIRGESESSSKSATPEKSRPKRKMSAAGRKAISEATKKRWAAVHAAAAKTKPAVTAKKATVTKAVAKAKLSPARKAALVANLAKARAAKAAKATAATAQ